VTVPGVAAHRVVMAPPSFISGTIPQASLLLMSLIRAQKKLEIQLAQTSLPFGQVLYISNFACPGQVIIFSFNDLVGR